MTTKQLNRTEEHIEGKEASALEGTQDVKNYLREVRHMYLYTQLLCARAEKYRELAMQATGRADAIRVSGTPDHSKVEKYVLELVETHEELQQRIAGLLRESRRAERLIGKIADERYHAVLQLRYLCGCSWEEISQRLCFTPRWVHKLHGEALIALEKMMQAERT